MSALIVHESSLFPSVVMDRENYSVNLDGNRVSGETVRMLEEKLNRYIIIIILLNNFIWGEGVVNTG